MTHDGEALLGGGLKPATLKLCKSSLGAHPCESQEEDVTSAGIQMCHVHLQLGCRSAHHSLVQSNTLMSFLSSSGGSSQRTRVRVCIPQSVQTHKTLTGSLCGAPQEVLRASGGIWPPKLHNRVKEQRLVF